MLRLRTLGGLALEGAPATSADDIGRRPLMLLALLAAAGEQGMSRERLFTFLWPESDGERARNSLSQALTSVRRHFGPGDVVLGTGRLRLNADRVSTDVQEFVRLLDTHDLQRAVALYAGPFLDGVFLKGAVEFEHWIDEQRRHFHNRLVNALELLATSAAARGDHANAVRWWRQCVHAEPLATGPSLGMMQALLAAGDAPAALRVYREHQALVREQLESEPDPRIVTFAGSLRATSSGSVPAAVEATPQQLTAPGESRALAPIEHIATPDTRRLGKRAPRLFTGGALVVLVGVLGLAALTVRGGDSALVVTSIVRLTRSSDSLHLDAAISPDGKYVAYAAGALGRMRIFIMPATGGSPRQVTDSSNVPLTPRLAGDHRMPRWSPDGTTIAFEAGRGIRLVSPNGGPTRVLVDTGQKPAWSPDGEFLAYAARQELRILSVDSATSRATGIRTNVSGGQVAWSPDGRRIAFVRGGTSLYIGGSTARYLGERAPSSVWIANVDGTNEQQLTSEDHLNAAPAWWPDGRSVLFVSDRDGVRDIYRQRLDADGRPRGTAERLTTAADVHTFSLSRDGSRVAWGTLLKRNEIWKAPVSAVTTPFTAAQRVTRERVARESVALSHDGRWLAYESDRGGRFRHIYKVAFDGTAAVGDPIRITRDSADDHAPRWSPDDRQLVFHRNVGGTRDIFVIGADGRRPERLTHDAGQDYDPDWSPDGRQVVYRSRLDSLGTIQEVFVVRRGADGRWGTPQPVTVVGREGLGMVVRWSPSGDLIGGGAGFIPAGGGEIRPFVDRKHIEGMVRFMTWGREPHALYFVTLDSTNTASFWRTELPVDRAAPSAPQLLLRLTDDTRRLGTNRFDTDGKTLLFLMAADEAEIMVGGLAKR